MHRYLKFLKSVPLLFAFVTVVAYGLLLPLTGFYWDDWPFAWIANFLGPKQFFPAFTTIRPFLAPIFFLTTSLIPTIPIYWQIFALVIRFTSGLSVWFALNQIFPRYKRQALILSLLFLVFPGYSQHWVAFTHINQEWIPFIFYLLSFGFTASALQHSSKFTLHSIFALLLLIAGVLPTEYFVSIEPLRFLFIWIINSKKGNGFRERFVQTFKYWIPYLLIWFGNAIWLAYFYTVRSYGSYDLKVINEPMTIAQLLLVAVEAIWKIGFYVWGQVILLASQTISAPSTLLTLTLIGITFVIFLFYFSELAAVKEESNIFAVPALLIGIAGILLGRIPSFTAGLPLTLQSSFDRFVISMMLGGSFFIVGLIELLIKNPHIKNYIFALLIALGIGQQFFNANIFRRDWARQQEIFWQLAWRIPAMKPNTVLLTDDLLTDYETDLSLTAPINWIYAPDYDGSDLPYAVIYTEIRLGGSLAALHENVEIKAGTRMANFHGSTSQAIVIYMPKNGCLRVLDPIRGDQNTYERQSVFLVDAIPLSDPSNIIGEAHQTAQLPFLTEPAHSWCYYYAKAELAYQKKNWNQVVNLFNEAISLGYQPEDPFEWLTYIEAQALTGNIETAQEMSNTVYARKNNIRKGLCEVWKRVQGDVAASNGMNDHINQILLDFECAH